MVEDYLQKLVTSAIGVDMTEVVRMAARIEDAHRVGASVWIVGNGGSASTAGHFANDLVKMAGVRAFSVPDQASVMMAYGNDEGWERMFSGYLERMLQPGDVIVAISCSGESRNVIEAVRLFADRSRIILTGNSTHSTLGLTDCEARVFVPDGNICIQEDVHLTVCHLVAGMVAERTRG